MSQANVEIARQAYEWVTVHQELKRDLFHLDFEFDATEVAPDTGGQLGFEAALEFLHGYWETFDDFRTRSILFAFPDAAAGDLEPSHRHGPRV